VFFSSKSIDNPFFELSESLSLEARYQDIFDPACEYGGLKL